MDGFIERTIRASTLPDSNETSEQKETQPWSSGPGEILAHGISLLKHDTDTNRRLAMLSIDNSVELMIKTFLGLPERVTGIHLARKQYEEVSESFPRLLDAIHEHAPDKVRDYNLSEIEWYHRLRNELYHQGNGLTVERQKVVAHAEIARGLISSAFWTRATGPTHTTGHGYAKRSLPDCRRRRTWSFCEFSQRLVSDSYEA
jgi:hypothetical protein